MATVDREIEQEILEILVAHAPVHVMDIAKTTGRHPITVDHICEDLHDQGHISPVGRGLYEVTEDGRHRIEDCHEA